MLVNWLIYQIAWKGPARVILIRIQISVFDLGPIYFSVENNLYLGEDTVKRMYRVCK